MSIKRILHLGIAVTVLSVMATACFAALPVPEPTRIYTGGAADGWAGRSWYGWYGSWEDTASTTLATSHDSSNRQSQRAVVIFDISSLFGRALAPNSVKLNFYSLGISAGVHLQHMESDPGAAVVAGFSQAGGTQIADPESGEGWMSYDVTSFIQSDVDRQFQHVGFVFASDNYCGGTIGAAEGGKASYLEVAPVPEPGSILALSSGLIGLMGFVVRRKNA